MIDVEKITNNVYLIRGYIDGSANPDPFEWVVLAVIEGYIATLKGFLHERNGRKVTPKQARSVDAFLRSRCCEKLSYIRIKNGKVTNVSRRL